MTLRFGTDGIRGVAGSELTPEVALAFGRAAAREFGWWAAAAGGPPSWRPGEFLVGRDTRMSGPMLLAAFSAGVAAEGLNVVDLGVLPTPGVAALCAAYRTPGAVISASHNPFSDNGIKLFAPGGIKLTPDIEARIEGRVAAPRGSDSPGAGGAVEPRKGVLRLGTIRGDSEARAWYERQLVASLEGRSLGGIRVVVDCGNGASTVTAETVLSQAGAEVVEVIGASPDGTNINAGCGSTDPESLQRAVVAHNASVGLAFDGDADRLIAVDAAGELVDGDRLMALCALDLHRRGCLNGETVVVTVMTNLGFHHAMTREGIAVRQTPVGDRQVLAALDAGGWSLGGEQSGHIIFRDLATTGDGVLSGLQVLDLMARSGRSLAELAASSMERLPQILRNVEVADPGGLGAAEAVWAEVDTIEADLAGGGRVLLRPSGTERVVRVMVEAATTEAAEAAADRLVDAVRRALG